MSSAPDIRWLQRFSNLLKAFNKLEEAVQLTVTSDLEKEGMIQRFEYTYELAWNTLKDYLQHQGFEEVNSPRTAITQAFAIDLIADGTRWLEMLKSRNQTAHTYNRQTAEEIAGAISTVYYPLFQQLIERLTREAAKLSP